MWVSVLNTTLQGGANQVFLGQVVSAWLTVRCPPVCSLSLFLSVNGVLSFLSSHTWNDSLVSKTLFTSSDILGERCTILRWELLFWISVQYRLHGAVPFFSRVHILQSHAPNLSPLICHQHSVSLWLHEEQSLLDSNGVAKEFTFCTCLFRASIAKISMHGHSG